MAKEWVKKAQNDATNEAHLRIEAEKFLGATKQECKGVGLKTNYRGEGEKEC